MADRAMPKRFKACKIRVHTQSTRGRKTTRNIRVTSATYHRPERTAVGSLTNSGNSKCIDDFVFDDNNSNEKLDIEETKSGEQGGLSKYHQRRVKEFSRWEAVRESLVKARIEEEAFPIQTCVTCAQPAVCRCVDCGPRQFFCMDCGKVLHSERNYFHILEIYKDGCFVPLMANHSVLSMSHQKSCPSSQCRTIICIDQFGNAFDGALRGHTTDILFIEEDAVLAPDFVKVAWFAGEVKRRNVGIIEYALGGWSGENMINAHPDTFVVRTSRQLRGVAYGLNQSTWLYFKSLEREFFEDGQNDWCNSMGMVLGTNIGKRAFRIIVPTLSRMWHIGAKGLGGNGDFNWDRVVTSQPNWAYASRLIELSSARVNLGLRDLLGFLCKERIAFWYLKDTECLFSFRRWKGEDRHRIMCAKQAYVKDLCDVYVS